jgi:DNA-binding XRE family transcriptional regulator
MMVTGEQVKQARSRLGESQAAFGARFGVDQSTVHRWESEGVPERGTTKIAVEHVLSGLPAETAPATEAAE